MADVVNQREGFGEVGVEIQAGGDGAGDLRDFERMGQAVAKMIGEAGGEDLGFGFEAAESAGVDDAIAVAGVIVAVGMRRFRVTAAARLADIHGVGCEHDRATSYPDCYHRRMLSEDAILKRLRTICLALPETTETITFGHPNFRVANKMFAVLEEYKGELGICVNVGKLMQGIFLDDPRFFRTPYIGRHGWVTLRVYAAKLNWNEIRELVKGSYDLVAPAKKPGKRKSGR